MSVEDIIVKLGVEDKLTAPLKKQVELLERLNQKQRRLTEVGQRLARQQKAVNKLMSGKAQKLVESSKNINALGKQHEGFFRVLGMSQENWNKFNKEGGEFNKRTSRTANSIRKLTHGLRGFRMEMLGVMFFGMGMQKFFTGLLRPAMEATGIFKLWSFILQMLFLPIAMTMLPILLEIMKVVMGWSDEFKLLIGKLVIAGIVIGGFLFLLGMFALGIGSVIMVGSSFFNLLAKLFAPLDMLKEGMGSFVAVGMGMGILSSIWDGFKGIVESLLQTFLEFDFVKELFKKLGVDVDESASAWDNFSNLAKGAIDKIKGLLGMGEGALGGVFEKLRDKANELWEEFELKLDEMGITGKDGLIESMKSISGSLEEMIPSLETIVGLFKILAPLAKAVAWVFGAGLPAGGAFPGSITGGYEGSTAGPILGGQSTGGGGGNTLNQTTNMTVNPSSNVEIDWIMAQVNNATNEQFQNLARG